MKNADIIFGLKIKYIDYKMICKKCNKDKGTDFRKSKNVCRECQNEVAREYRKKLKEKKDHGELKKSEFIICNKCEQKTSNFRINRRSCLDCERKHGRHYRKTTTKAKEWAGNNRERMTELQRKWQRSQCQNNPIFKMCVAHRTAIYNLIHGTLKSSKHVNCTRARLINWLQYQFDEKMTLENHGEVWSVDHVLPIHCVLKNIYPKEVVLNWVNIRPICKTENMKRSKNYTKEECKQHLHVLKNYYKIRKLEKDEEYIKTLKNALMSFAKHLVAGNS